MTLKWFNSSSLHTIWNYSSILEVMGNQREKVKTITILRYLEIQKLNLLKYV